MRDRQFEAEWRAHLRDQIGLHIPDPADAFDRSIIERIELGEQRFGDAWLQPGWDGCAEALEETVDIPVYLLLETQLRRMDGRGGAHQLLAAATHAGIADAFVRQAMRRD